MVNCNFHLENNQNAVFFAGQLIKGQIELFLDHPKSIRSFSFIVHGVAYCHWTETHTETRGHGKDRRSVTRTVHYEGKEVYLNSETFLFGSKDGQTKEMAAGTYRYDFQCHLPEHIPASFEATHGHIRYNVEAKMDIPWKFDKEFKLQITVVRNDDLNFYPELRIPLSCEDVKTFCCCCCRSEPLMFKVTIPHGGFAVGHDIPVRVEYYNKSDVEVEGTTISLRRILRYISHTPHSKTRVDTEDVARTTCEGVRESTNKIHEVNLNIPRILVKSNDRYCRVVQVSYELKVEARTTGCHANVDLKFPITIGTTPFMTDGGAGQMPAIGQLPPVGQMISPGQPPYNPGQPPYNPQFDGSMPSAPPAMGSPEKGGYSPVPTSAPPTFEEAVKMDGQNLNSNQANQMNFNQTTSQQIGWTIQTPQAPQEKQ